MGWNNAYSSIPGEYTAQFRYAMQAAGLEPPAFIECGKLYRLPGVSKRKSNRAGWCILFPDGLGGCFGDWSSGFSETWQVKRSRPFSQYEKAVFKNHLIEARALAAKERRVMHAEAAIRAEKIWQKAVSAPDNHLYIVRKGIRTHGAGLCGNALVLPVQDFKGNFTSLQFIHPDGKKLLLSGGKKQGCFIHVSGSITGVLPRIIITEGWATGCTLAEYDPEALVLAAIDAGNLQSVAVTARNCWPHAEIIVAGDDDRLTPGNPGANKAREAAIMARALLAFPQWPADAPEDLSDFNDLTLWFQGRGVQP